MATAILFAAELGLRAFGQELGDPILWGPGESSIKVAQVEGLPRSIDLLVVGPSHASLGFSPADMRLELGRRDLFAYNLGLNGYDYPVAEFLLRHVVLEHTEPRVLVISASPLSFNCNDSVLSGNGESFFQAAWPRALRDGGITRVMVEHVQLYRYRRFRRDLAAGREGGRLLVDADGYHPAADRYGPAARAELLSGRHAYRNMWRDFEFGGRSHDAFVRIVQEARRREIRVVVVNMPFRDSLFELADNSRQAYRAYLEGMACLQSQLDFLWLDYQADLPLEDRHFEDTDHLNRQGAALLSRSLAHDLRRAQILPYGSPYGSR